MGRGSGTKWGRQRVTFGQFGCPLMPNVASNCRLSSPGTLDALHVALCFLQLNGRAISFCGYSFSYSLPLSLSLSWLPDCSSVDLYLIAAANNVCKHCNRLGHSLPLGHHLWGLAGRFDVVPMPTLLAPCGERPVAFIVTNWASWGLLHQGAVYSSRQRGIMSSPLAQLINVLLAVRRHYYVHKYL